MSPWSFLDFPLLHFNGDRYPSAAGSSWDKIIWGTVKGRDTVSCSIHFPFLALIMEFEQEKVTLLKITVAIVSFWGMWGSQIFRAYKQCWGKKALLVKKCMPQRIVTTNHQMQLWSCRKLWWSETFFCHRKMSEWKLVLILKT